MYFPGADYLPYVQNMTFPRARKGMQEFGMTRFLNCDVNSQMSAQQSPGRMLDELEHDEWFQDKYVFAYEQGDRMIQMTPEGMGNFPIWNIRTDPSVTLEIMAQQNEYVFIRNDIKQFQMASTKAPMSLQYRLREMWEIVHTYGGGGTGVCKFILFGYYMLQPSMCMGMSGGSFHPVIWDSRHRVAMQPSGRRGHFEDFSVEELMSTLRISESAAADPISVNLRAFQLMPEYLERYYEELPRIQVRDGYIAEALYELKEMFARRLYWQSTLRDVFAIQRPHANIWSIQGDKNVCNECSVSYSCKLYEEGSVCILPNTEGKTLATLFGSRSSKKVIEGIGKLLEFQARRFEEAVETEEKARAEAIENNDPVPPLDPQIEVLANNLHRNATNYAKLLNPALLKPPLVIKPGVNGTLEIEQKPPTGPEMATAARELEALGYDRQQITAGMINEHIQNKLNGKAATNRQPVVVNGVKQDF